MKQVEPTARGRSFRSEVFAVGSMLLAASSLAIVNKAHAEGSASATVDEEAIRQIPTTRFDLAGFVGPTATSKLDFGGGLKMGQMLYKLDPSFTGGGYNTGYVTSRFEPFTFDGGRGKVSLFGEINNTLTYTDNGLDDDFYFSSNAASLNYIGARIRYDLNDEWRIGGRVSVAAAYNRSDIKIPGEDEAGCDEQDRDKYFCAYDANAYLRSKTFGKLTVGLGETAYTGIGSINLGGTAYITNNDPNLRAGGYEIDGTGRRLEDIAADPTGVTRGTGIRYDSPTFAGFVLSASWGEADHVGAPVDADDYWDVALRYAGEFGAIRVAAGVGYQDYDREGANRSQSNLTGGASIMHTPTGLYLSGSVSDINRDAPGDPGAGETDSASAYYVQAGIRQRWIDFGDTTLYTEYGQTDSGGNVGNYFEEDSKTSNFGLGIAQNFDNSSKSVYGTYNLIDGDFGGSDGDKIDIFTVGARIKF